MSPPSPRRRRHVAMQNVPYLDEKQMDDTPPDCSLASFQKPRLRRSRFTFDSIDWKRSIPIDGGLDGFVWKVWFGQQGPFAMKVYWDTKPFDDFLIPTVQRDCQNAALLQMMATALDRAKKESTPIMGWLDAKDQSDAQHNTDSFADEIRRQDPSRKLPGEVEIVSTMPRVAKCHGWLRFSGAQYTELVPSQKQAPTVWVGKYDRTLSHDAEEIVAIVYEWIKKGENDPVSMEATCRFFWLAGFSWNDGRIMAQNWHRSILLDHSDIVQPRGLGWDSYIYGPREAKTIMDDLTVTGGYPGQTLQCFHLRSRFCFRDTHKDVCGICQAEDEKEEEQHDDRV